GGGINNSGTTTPSNCTVRANSAVGGAGAAGGAAGPAEGGGIAHADRGTVNVDKSTISGNRAGGSPSRGARMAHECRPVPVESSIIASAGFNLIGSTNAPVSPGTNDQFNVTGAQLKLTPLQDNGGPTFTHAPLCGSPAIDAGDNTDAPETDQRGFVRIFRGVIDIGACEDSNTAPTVLCPAPVSFDTHASRPVAATVSVQ